MDDLNLDDLVIRVDRTAPVRVRLDWLGCSDGVKPEAAIGPFFSQVLAEANGATGGVEMHFEKLEYFNSATIATLIQLIRQAGKADVALRIYYAAQLEWQALSFGALERAVHSVGGGRGAEVEFLSAAPAPLAHPD